MWSPSLWSPSSPTSFLQLAVATCFSLLLRMTLQELSVSFGSFCLTDHLCQWILEGIHPCFSNVWWVPRSTNANRNRGSPSMDLASLWHETQVRIHATNHSVLSALSLDVGKHVSVIKHNHIYIYTRTFKVTSLESVSDLFRD